MSPKVASGLQQVRIEQRRVVSSEVIYREHLSGDGMPVILSDQIKEWQALSSWSLDFFKSRYGSETVLPGLGVYGKSRRVMKLSDFIDYVESPSIRPRGFWIDPKTRLPRAETADDLSAPLYLYDQHLFLRHSRLLDDVQPDPECLDDWLRLLPDNFQRLLQSTRFYQRGLLIGPEGSIARLHYDFLHTHAYLAQIVGRKFCILFSPRDSEFLYGGEVNPEKPDLDRFPLFPKAKAFVCTLEPGQMLLMPSQWWHYVRNLEPSITVNYNFFNRVNFGEYFADLVRVLPEIFDGQLIPGGQEQLGVDSVSKSSESSNLSNDFG